MAGLGVGSRSVRLASSCPPVDEAGPERVSVRRSFLSLTGIVVFALTSLVSGCKSTPAPVANVTIDLSPLNVSVGLGSTQQFTAVASGSTDTGIYWEVNGVLGGDTGNAACNCGTITQQGTNTLGGLYTPPAIVPSPNTVSVSAVAHANSNDVTATTVTLVSNVSVAVSPGTADLKLGGTQQFNATVSGTKNQTVTWQAGGVTGGNSTAGTISTSGLYTAPTSATPLPMSVSVTAISQADATKSRSVSITLHSAITVAVSPGLASVQTFMSQQFMSLVTGNSNTNVTWEVNSIPGGGPTTGTISQTGLYTAPNSVPTQASGGSSITAPVIVTAVSQADSFFTASSTVTVIAPNKNSQTSPTPLGVSGGNINDSGSGQCSGGTLGSLVSQGGNQYILGTSSVLAREDLGAIRESIIQPSLTDAAVSCNSAGTTTVANLSQFYNLETGTGTKVDTAIARVVPGAVDPAGTILLLGGTTSNNQPTNGAPHAGSGVAPAIGQHVAKSGRSTGLTCSTIQATNLTVTIQYQKGFGASAANFSVTYTDLVQIANDGTFSATGDAGSLIVTRDTADPVALLIASFSTLTLANPISDVLAAMGNPVFVGPAGTHTVAGCLPPLQPAAISSPAVTISPEALLQASAVRNIHATELLATAGVQAVGVNSSSDDPNSLAIELFLTKDVTPGSLPAQIDGLRTKIVKVGTGTDRGVLSFAESETLESSANASSVTPLSDAEVARARAVHSAHVDELMKLAGVQGVGISSSIDNPGEAALMIYLIRGAAHAEIPAVIGGVRTRIKASSPFVASPQ
jgi:hypothetical protein